MKPDRRAARHLCLAFCLGVAIVGTVPGARALIPSMLYTGQVDSFSFNYQGTISWAILADVCGTGLP